MSFNRSQHAKDIKLWEHRHATQHEVDYRRKKKIAEQEGDKYFYHTCLKCRSEKRYTKSGKCVRCARDHYYKNRTLKPRKGGKNEQFYFPPTCGRCRTRPRVRGVKNPNTGKQYFQKYCHPCRVEVSGGKYWKKS